MLRPLLSVAEIEYRQVGISFLMQGERAKRSERALVKTRILAMNPAKCLQTASSTTKLTHSIILTRFTRFALASLKMRTISLRMAQPIAPPLYPS